MALLDKLLTSRSSLEHHCDYWDSWIAPIYDIIELPATAQMFQDVREMHDRMTDPVWVLSKKQHVHVTSWAKSSGEGSDEADADKPAGEEGLKSSHEASAGKVDHKYAMDALQSVSNFHAM